MQSSPTSRAGLIGRAARLGAVALRLLAGLLATVAGVAVIVAAVSAATGGRFLVVEGGSMRPALQPGDLLVVRPCAPGLVRRGDLVNYQPHVGAAAVTHRVVSVTGRGKAFQLTTKGDANSLPDTIATGESSVRGKVVAVVPRIGTLARLLRTPFGFAAGILLPALALVVGEIRRIRRVFAR